MAPKPVRIPSYPRSTTLAGLEWLTESSRYPESRTDMHWWTWGDDGALYFADDDGENFGLPWNFAHLLKATGTPPTHTVEEISAFPELVRPETLRYRRYVDGAVAVGSRLFVAAYDYDDSAAEDGAYEYRHVDLISPHGGVASLMFSDDYGTTWQNAPEPREERATTSSENALRGLRSWVLDLATRGCQAASETTSTPSRTIRTGRPATTSSSPACLGTECSIDRNGSSLPAVTLTIPVGSTTRRQQCPCSLTQARSATPP